MKTIQPSLLAFDLKQIPAQLTQCVANNITTIHYDVMDHKYVPNSAFRGEFIALIHSYHLNISVHLMTKNVVAQVQKYLQYPVQTIIIHPDADIASNVTAALDLIQTTPSVAAGLAIKGYQAIEPLLAWLVKVQFVLMMGVQPGAGGQKYQAITTKQLQILQNIKTTHNLNFEIILDGGVNLAVVAATKAYVDHYVTGSYLMQASDFATTYQALWTAANQPDEPSHED